MAKIKNKEYAIIVAGGKGTRMHSGKPKQFMLLNGLPVLMHTINAFTDYSKDIQIIVVLPKDDISAWEKLAKDFDFKTHISIAEGGASRFQSVKNGLNLIKSEKGLVAIHDGVRPLIHIDTIGTSFRIAAVHQSAVAAVRLKESLRLTDQACQQEGSSAYKQNTTKAVDRASYRLIQTPQTFDLSLIKKAYDLPEEPSLTDDASVAEKAGHKISLFEGSYDNIKITTPEDMVIAEALLNSRTKNPY